MNVGWVGVEVSVAEMSAVVGAVAELALAYVKVLPG